MMVVPGEAEAGSAGKQLAEEYLGLRCVKGARQPAELIVWWVVFLQLWTSE